MADGVDQDCDNVDTCYTDSDGDNYGTTATSDGSSLSCSTGTGAANDDDCDDASASVYPGATETTADGIDQDCDNVDTCYTDSDGDNYGLATTMDGSSTDCASGTGAANSDDCNDADSAIHPGAADPTDGDLVDDDCDDLYDEDDIIEGDVVFTEFFVGAAGSYEWVEIYNNSGVALNLQGWTLTVCTDSTTTESLPYVCATDSENTTSGTDELPYLEIPAGGYAVLCQNDASFTSGQCDAEWSIAGISAIATNNGGFYLDLLTTDVDDFDFWNTSIDDWPSSSSNSVQLSSDVLDATAGVTNDDWSSDGTNDDQWCLSSSTTDWASGATYYGSPGAANEDCTP